MNIVDLISVSVALFYVIPPVLYAITKNVIHIKAFLGVIGTTVISETLKYFFIGDLSPRPKGAKDCNLLCNDGDQAGRPGMPSSHSAEAAFILGFYYQQYNNKYIRLILVIYTALVMLSRYLKKCHTINQVFVGAFLGLLLSWLSVRLL
jgi:membrane-associated phospholipid phosphatase